MFVEGTYGKRQLISLRRWGQEILLWALMQSTNMTGIEINVHINSHAHVLADLSAIFI